MSRARRILHATDFSEASAPAFREALRMARAERAALLLLHVLEPPSPFLGDERPRSYVELLAAARHGAERRMAAAVRRARTARVRVIPRLVEGTAWEEIPRVARRWRPDVIVLGTHGRSGLGRAVMGSVAERVLPRAPCPVLTVRGGR